MTNRRRYVGWIYEDLENKGVFIFKPTHDALGNKLREETAITCNSDRDAVEKADKWFDTRISLEPTPIWALGLRIYLEEQE